MIKKIWLKTKRFLLFWLEKIVFIQTVVILTVVYFLALGPVAILAKIFGRDFLMQEKKKTQTFWQKRKLVSFTLEEASRQY